MRNRQWAGLLRRAFSAPPPVNRDQFLRKLPYPKLTYGGFVRNQLRYMHWRVYALSAAIILVGAGLSYLPGDWLRLGVSDGRCWAMAALLPFLALAAAAELSKASCCRMAEFEMTCRFSLHQIIMARLTLLGGGNLAVLLCVLLMMKRVSPFTFSRMAAYLLTPYLLAGALCLAVLNYVRGRNALYGCAAAACAVSVVGMAANMERVLYAPQGFIWWRLLLAASILVFIGQLIHFMKRTEEIQCSFI